MTVQAREGARRSETTPSHSRQPPVEHRAPYARRGVLPLPSQRRASIRWWRLAAAGVVGLSCLCGVAAGVGAAALGLALASKAITVLSVEQAETLLVVCPLAGLLPMSFLLLAARRSARVAHLLPGVLGAWLAGAAAAFAWLAFSPELR